MFCSCKISTDSASRGPSAIAEPLVNFCSPIYISGIAEARAAKFWEIISSLAKRDDISLINGAWFGSRDSFLHAQLWT